MKAILISVQPQWVAKILNGEKTLEIRKSMPKCGLPIEVYIYCCKSGALLFKEQSTKTYWAEDENKSYRPNYALNGKVIGKFTLNKVEEIEKSKYNLCYTSKSLTEMNLLKHSCLTFRELHDYLQGKNGYAWHIDNLEIFDKPKELSEFYGAFSYDGGKPFINTYTNSLVHKVEINGEIGYESVSHLTRAPQSWCYIEV